MLRHAFWFAFNTIPDGVIVAYSNSPLISQTVGPTVEAGVTYTMQIDLGWRKDYPAFASAVDLLINGTQYVATGTAPTQGDWSTFTATYTGLAADVGDPITIELRNTNSSLQADFDNVRLSSNPPPASEPSSIALLGMAFAVMGFALRVSHSLGTSTNLHFRSQ
jgi:hypothetical protein